MADTAPERVPAIAPYIDLRLLTNNNRVDLAGEGLDAAVRFGDGSWHGTRADMLLRAPLSPMCTPALAQRLRHPGDLASQTLLRSTARRNGKAGLRQPDSRRRWRAAPCSIPR